MSNTTSLAAVDLGSNSFRLEIGTIQHGQFYRTEYLKETVRQGNGLDCNSNLTQEAMQRGWDCLKRFGERLQTLQVSHVIAVATQTLREAKNRDVFLTLAGRLLGFPIEVISGLEEARLIYLGVAKGLSNTSERRLVIDIGGRSTELIVGYGLKALQMDSYPVGSVAWSMHHFSNGVFSTLAFKQAEQAAKKTLAQAIASYSSAHWDHAYGSAGTVNAVEEVLACAHWPQGFVTRDGLDWLLEKLLQTETADRLELSGMREDRKAIIGGGLSVLRALFELLDITRLEQASGGLRHGLLWDLTERINQQAIHQDFPT